MSQNDNLLCTILDHYQFKRQQQQSSEHNPNEQHRKPEAQHPHCRQASALMLRVNKSQGSTKQHQKQHQQQQQQQQQTMKNGNRHTRQANGLAHPLIRLSTLTLLLVAATVLLVASSQTGAEYAQPQQHDVYQTGYDQHQQQQGPPSQSKAKKIQIVYIKVPLAKLKPSLVNADNSYSGSSAPASGQQADNNSSSTYAANGQQQQQQKGGQYDATEQTKSQGSQSADQQHNALDENQQQTDQQQQLSRQQQQQQQQQSSFLIPMAVVQTPYEADQPSSSSSGQQQQQQWSSSSSSMTEAFGKNFGGSAASTNYASHSQPLSLAAQMMMASSPSFFGSPNDGFHMLHQQQQHPGGRRSRQQQTPVQHYNQLMQSSQPASSSSFMSSPSVSHGINHGFMSSFLMGEKEKMTAAAMRSFSQLLPQTPQQNQQSQPLATAASNTVTTAAPAAQTSSSSTSPISNNVVQPNQQQPTSPPPPPSTTFNKQGPGGLMPLMMMPYSHMPDNMIGQAYNAAVGQALPVESGSPATLLSSPSTTAHLADNNNINNNGKRGNSNSNYGGGSSGTPGDVVSSLGTASSGSYGANGQGQSDSSSPGNGYQHSASGYAGSAPSLGFGNGINSFGASVAFSDYPLAQSTGSGQQIYTAQQQQQSGSNNNNNYNSHHLSQSSDDSSYANQKLKQAKKTIIPIVVQVEHAILENNQAQPNVGYGQQQQPQLQQQQQPTRGGNKYGATGSGRAYRQLNGQNGGGKRGRNNNKSPENQYRQNGNQIPYGASTNDSPLNGPQMDMGGASAQYINAANAQDINQITAQINAENAASAAAALAQADMAFGSGAPAYIPSNSQQRPGGPQHHHSMNGPRPASQYAAGLQSAASALLANTHPVIQAAASGGLASVSKLGAKLGEIIALPSMQVPSSISSIGASLPSALNQMGVQIGQAVQQVAKEHPTAHAFARQVAQHAGISLPNFGGQQNNGPAQHQQHPNQFNSAIMNPHQQQQANQQQQMVAASSQLSQSMSPQAQLQNLKLSIGQNLQTAAAQLIGVHQKANAQSAASLLANPLAALYPQSMNAALKQLSGMASAGPGMSAFGQSSAILPGGDFNHAQSSSIISVQQQPMSPMLNQQLQQQQSQISQLQAAASSSDPHSPTSQSALVGAGEQKPSKSLKSKFLSFFQPPKFISNMFSWNDRADDRNDQGELASATIGDSKRAEESGPVVSVSTTTANNGNKTASANQEESMKKQPTEVSSGNSTEQAQTAESAKAAPVAASSATAPSNSSSAVAPAEQPKVVKSEVASAPANSTSSSA